MLAKIRTTTNDTLRLHLLDSLTGLVLKNKKYPYDSLTRKTIQLALKQENYDLASYHFINHFYEVATVAGDLKVLDSMFRTFENKYGDKIISSNRKANFFKAGGNLYAHMNNYEKAIKYYKKALNESLRTKNLQNTGEIYAGLGGVYYDLGNFTKSTDYLQKALPYFIEVKDTNSIINLKNIIVNLYAENGFYNQAEKERKEAILLAKKKRHWLFLSQIYFNYAAVLGKRNQLQDKIKYLKKALEAVEKSRYKSFYKPIYLSEMVSVQADVGDINTMRYYKKLLDSEPLKNQSGEPYAFYLKAQMKWAFSNGENAKALEMAKKLYNERKKNKHYEGIKEAELFLAHIYEKTGNYKEANRFLNLYEKHRDSLQNIYASNQLAYYQMQYETQKRDFLISEQKSKIALLEARNKINKQRMFFGGMGLLSFFLIFSLYRSRNFIRKQRDLQKEFSRKLMEEQETERKRIAKELHDGIGQKILLIKHSLESHPEKTHEIIHQTLEEIRNISRNLHPIQLEKFGLTQALKNMVEEIKEVTNIFISYEINNINGFFSKEKEIYLYRIIQECFNNIIKHSGASAAKLEILRHKDHVFIKIQDNGKGFDLTGGRKKKPAFGLQSLSERVDFLRGKITFESIKNKGTVISIISYKS